MRQTIDIWRKNSKFVFGKVCAECAYGKRKNITKNYNMIFNISSKNLMSHLSAVSKVVNSKNSISILDNFLFELNGDEGSEPAVTEFRIGNIYQ